MEDNRKDHKANLDRDRDRMHSNKDSELHAKDKVAETAHNVKEAVVDKAHHAKDKVAETAHNVKEAVVDKAHHAKDKVVETAHNIKEAVVDKAHHAKDKIVETAHNVKEAITEKLHNTNDAFKESVINAMGMLKENGMEDHTKDAIVTKITLLKSLHRQLFRFICANIVGVFVWMLSGGGYFWPIWVILIWGGDLLYQAHGLNLLDNMKKYKNKMIAMAHAWEKEQENKVKRK